MSGKRVGSRAGRQTSDDASWGERTREIESERGHRKCTGVRTYPCNARCLKKLLLAITTIERSRSFSLLVQKWCQEQTTKPWARHQPASESFETVFSESGKPARFYIYYMQLGSNDSSSLSAAKSFHGVGGFCDCRVKRFSFSMEENKSVSLYCLMSCAFHDSVLRGCFIVIIFSFHLHVKSNSWLIFLLLVLERPKQTYYHPPQ